ncbi:Uncharacterized protein FVE85_3234 [Porphyridium purpureum]|uniref:DNA/RNA-binding protein Alba-like domain-containing protein n=1 Tax=Porphyridium purpureum TaxID=35688 RepID=A0A5J4YW69_PORPP|nr:Uncharacterized protein FVE85_3234 [Porphyridium purpureum]|eukprot:POR8286..scf227_4
MAEIGQASAAEVVVPADAVGSDMPEKMRSNRIQVSKDKKPQSFFLNLAKRFLSNHQEVELSGLGGAIVSTVTLAEILKSQGYVSIVRVETSLVAALPSSGSGAEAGVGDKAVADETSALDASGRTEDKQEESAAGAEGEVPSSKKENEKSKHKQNGGAPKPKIQIWITKTKEFDELIKADEAGGPKRKGQRRNAGTSTGAEGDPVATEVEVPAPAEAQA